MKRWILAACAPLALACGTAQAADEEPRNLGKMTPGYSYFNRPGATMATHDADVAYCLSQALNVRSAQEQFRNGSFGIIPLIIDNLRANSANRGVVSAALENCMVVHGWRVVSVDDAEGLAMTGLPGAELSARLSPWIGASEPHGRIARVWRNDAALAAVNHFSLHANHTKNGQLSLLALETSVSTALKQDTAAKAEVAKPTRIELDPKWPLKPLKPASLDTVPAFAATVIVNINGVSLRQGNGFAFRRVGPDPMVMLSAQDRGPDIIGAFVGAISASKNGKFLAFAVPPGRWRINSLVGGLLELNFCLGAPAFEVKAGEVVYAGELNMKQEQLLPGFDLAPLKTWMAGARAADRVRPAEYVNGSRGACGATNIYALEFAGMPFEPGYALGSRVGTTLPAQ